MMSHSHKTVPNIDVNINGTSKHNTQRLVLKMNKIYLVIFFRV